MIEQTRLDTYKTEQTIFHEKNEHKKVWRIKMLANSYQRH
jgi:hypothetical protein